MSDDYDNRIRAATTDPEDVDTDGSPLGPWFNPIVLVVLALPLVALFRLRAWLRAKLSQTTTEHDTISYTV